jgi:Putative peptidoglycan binding domain
MVDMEDAMKHAMAGASLLFFVTMPAFGHGGGLDRNGCHTNRKTGEYHCHQARTAAPEQPAPAPARAPEPAGVPHTQRISSTVVTAAPTNGARDLVRAAQVLLRALGYDPSLLGNADARTQAAVRAFQRTENLSETGAINEYLVLRLAEKAAMKCR